MSINTIAYELVPARPLTEKQLVNLVKERKYRNAVYEQTYIRRVLFEKYERHSLLEPTSLRLYE